MINAFILRYELLAMLQKSLGIYLFSDGSRSGAIAVLPDPDNGWNYPPQGTKVSGLEVIIKLPYPDLEANLGGDRAFEYSWEIHLKQWDSNKSLLEIIELLLTSLPSEYLLSGVTYIPVSDKLLAIEQCKFYLKEWAISVVP
jgi:hypothetical protein